MKDKSLRVLMIEDSEDDALLEIRELKKGGYKPVYERVETAVAMKKALQEKQWDIILCDYKMPNFYAPSAIAILKEANIDIPLIIVSGTIGEDVAVECMLLGAHDYIMKGNLSRLCPAIARELKDAEVKNKQKDTEEKLRREEQRFRAFVEHSSDIIVLLNLEGIITYINPAVERVLGFKPEERIGARGLELIHPDDRKSLIDKFNTFVKDINAPVVRFEMRLLHKDGSWRTVEAVESNLVKNNVVEAIIVNYRDITERKRMEEILRDKEQRFRTFVENSSDIIAIFNREGIITYENPAVERSLGLKTEERIGGSIFDRIHPDDLKFASGAFNKFTLNTSSQDINSPVRQIRLRHQDGSWRTFETSGSKLLYDNIVEAVIINLRDITDRKRAEDELRESEEKYRLIFEYSPLGLLSFDEKGVIINCNDNFVKIIGSSREKLIGLNMLNLPDKKMVSTIQKALNGSTGLYEGLYSSVTSKKITPTRAIFASMTTEDERILGGVGIIEDITERKQAEEALREGEELYRTIFENTGTSMILIEEDMTISMSNGEFVRNTGYSPDEINGRMKWTEIIHPDDLERMVEQHRLRRESQGGELPSYEFRYITKKGDLRDTFLTIKLVPGTKKSIASLIDITKRKQAEEKLQQTLESLRKAVGTTIQVLVSALESRDPYTSGHQSRSADLACVIATEMGLAHDKIEGIRMAGIIHDIGKLSIPVEILSKPTKLTDIEFSLIKEHSRSGYEMLKNVESPWPLAEIVYQHHERMNGSGYPRNLKGDEILMESRILAVADVVEAMASHRPYRPTLGIEAALEEIEKNKGILYDNAVADACLRLFREKGYQLT